MKKRIYNPPPAPAEKLPACPACGSVDVKALDNWLLTPCLRMLKCNRCGRQVTGEGQTIHGAKVDALRKWAPREAEDGKQYSGLLEEET